ncbi:MAG: hypothetical protein KDE56_02610 [Anaerolineales bacterium]|nr:hypothetical protein [Anaerolineales bacterium]
MGHKVDVVERGINGRYSPAHFSANATFKCSLNNTVSLIHHPLAIF